MSSVDKPANDRPDGDKDTPEERSMDHFYQLVLMHRKAQEVWKEEMQENNDPEAERLERLADERKRLLQRKASKKSKN